MRFLPLTPTIWLELMASGKVASTSFHVTRRRGYVPQPPASRCRIPWQRPPPAAPSTSKEMLDPSANKGSKHRVAQFQNKTCGRSRGKTHCEIVQLQKGRRIFLARYDGKFTTNPPNMLKADVAHSRKHEVRGLENNNERTDIGNSEDITWLFMEGQVY